MRTHFGVSRILTVILMTAPAVSPAQPPAALASASNPAATTAPLAVTAGFPADRFVSRHALLELKLNRPLTTDDGDVAVVVGSVDLTSMFARDGSRLVYRSRAVALPAGDQQVTVYQVRGGKWAELAKFPLKVLTAGGFTKSTIAPSLSMNNNGQLAEGRSGGIPEPPRRTFQDFSFSTGERSSHERQGWSVATQSNYVGVTRREQALRFGVERDQAPRFDLADYLLLLRGTGGTEVAAGHVNFGRNRHLVNGFASRGFTVATTRAGATLTLGSANGSSVVGWSNFLGLDQPHHRVNSAALGVEVMRRRPGALHIELTGLDGSRLPQAGFTRGAVVDAEESRGGGIELSAATPSQRARFAGGYTRSSFVNPSRDPQLTGSQTLVPARRDTRGARYVELGLGLLQNARLFGHIPTNATLGYRHERVDPLFRSVGASAQADRQQNAFDLSTNLGVLTAQLAHSRATDNLGHVASVLTSPTRTMTASLAAPLAGLVRVKTHQALWPSLTYSLNRTHQFATKSPTNGDFRPVDLPDQVSLIHDAGAQWLIGRWRASYHVNASAQDNRQPGRERSDFSATSNAWSLGTAVGQRFDVSVDANLEQRHNEELDQTNTVRRVGTALNWRPDTRTTLGTTVSLSHAEDDPRTTSATNGEYRVEMSRAITLRRPTGQSAGTTGQLVLRYARTQADADQFSAPGVIGAPRTSQTQWTLSSGLSLRLF